MALDNRLITAFVFTLNVVQLLADSDPQVIAYDDLMRTANVFTESQVSHFSQLLVDGHDVKEELIVGARDNIYRLKVDDLQLIQKAEWKAPSTKIHSCIEKGQSENDCRNYIKVLHINDNRLFACGTNAFSPNCTKRELNDIDQVVQENNGQAKCPYSPHANMTSLMTDDGAFFAGLTMGFAGFDGAIIGNGDYNKILRTTQFDPKWLNDPQFVGSFETDTFVYFLFRENAVEYMNCGKAMYSRIARVCKNDRGDGKGPIKSWTTFAKTRLNCSLPGEYPFYFDEIQGVSYLPDAGQIYATFTTPRNSIAGSAVCLFDLKTINKAFSGPFKHQETINSTWESVPNVSPKTCRFQGRDELPSKFQLMDTAVQPVTKSPLYYKPLERIVHVTVDDKVIAKRQKKQINLHILYISTEENLIKKISVSIDTMETCVVEIWKATSHLSDRILSMHFLKEKESLYVGTEMSVMRIPLQHCDRYRSKETCLDARDPYCGWNEHLSLCTPPPDKNPLLPHWNQLVGECPKFTQPVPGGWSMWSAWAPCDQTNSFEERDQCMCSSRQCNNPAPQNGGEPCQGTHIRVTNCTVHGGWTDWSEWSACSPSCGNGAVKIRSRSCTNPAPAFGGRVCNGREMDSINCVDNPPCPSSTPADLCPAWKSWSECSAKCGDGIKFRTRERSWGHSAACPDNFEVRSCFVRTCSTPPDVDEWTTWECVGNDVEQRYHIVGKLVNSTAFIKINVSREERNSSERALCSDICGPWSNWSECDHLNVQTRRRKCMAGNNGRRCPCSDDERRQCHNWADDKTTDSKDSGCITTVTLFLACFSSFVLGIAALAACCYYYKIKKKRHVIPSSPFYATKQNYYVNIPLREPPTPKRTPSFSKNSILTNGTPKSASNGTIKAVVKPMEYDTATIKRNSNNLKNGYAKSFDFDEDADRYS